MNSYKVSLEYIHGGTPKKVTIRANNATEAEVIAEQNNRGYAAVDSVKIAPAVRVNRFPTMLGN